VSESGFLTQWFFFSESEPNETMCGYPTLAHNYLLDTWEFILVGPRIVPLGGCPFTCGTSHRLVCSSWPSLLAKLGVCCIPVPVYLPDFEGFCIICLLYCIRWAVHSKYAQAVFRIRDPVLFYPPGSGIRIWDGAIVGSGSGIRDPG
jgi:hypothetical protein